VKDGGFGTSNILADGHAAFMESFGTEVGSSFGTPGSLTSHAIAPIGLKWVRSARAIESAIPKLGSLAQKPSRPKWVRSAPAARPRNGYVRRRGLLERGRSSLTNQDLGKLGAQQDVIESTTFF